jgi:hypothetical protein
MHHRRSATAVCDHPPGHGPQVHDAEQGDPDGETILFLPAFGDSWFFYNRHPEGRPGGPAR